LDGGNALPLSDGALYVGARGNDAAAAASSLAGDPIGFARDRDKEDARPMTKVTFIDASGASRTVEAQIGSTVMETALRNSVPGIEAECGGACACATCHVYVAPEWTDVVGKPAQMEEDMLDFAADVRPNSRLSCQIKVTEALDGLIVTTPARQG
jgi:2Fe-2S ferredoxin